jgi:hypothetical protein
MISKVSGLLFLRGPFLSLFFLFLLSGFSAAAALFSACAAAG